MKKSSKYEREHSVIAKIENLLQNDIPIEGYMRQMLEKAPHDLVQMMYQQPIENLGFGASFSTDSEMRSTKPQKLFLS